MSEERQRGAVGGSRAARRLLKGLGFFVFFPLFKTAAI